MSKYGVTSTVLREEKCLLEALTEMGYQVEVHPEGAPGTLTTRNKVYGSHSPLKFDCQ